MHSKSEEQQEPLATMDDDVRNQGSNDDGTADQGTIAWNRWPPWLVTAYVELCKFFRNYGWYVTAGAIVVYLVWPYIAAWRLSAENERYR